jgi:hypothetical protein
MYGMLQHCTHRGGHSLDSSFKRWHDPFSLALPLQVGMLTPSRLSCCGMAGCHLLWTFTGATAACIAVGRSPLCCWDTISQQVWLGTLSNVGPDFTSAYVHGQRCSLSPRLRAARAPPCRERAIPQQCYLVGCGSCEPARRDSVVSTQFFRSNVRNICCFCCLCVQLWHHDV